MCVPFKGLAGNNLLSSPENDGTEHKLSLGALLGVKEKMEPTSLLIIFLPHWYICHSENSAGL